MMLRFNKLGIKNYGPYYGDNILTFSQKNGVTVIWGNNGFGKTSILNCFRFVMWGIIMGRDNKIGYIPDYVNDKAVERNEDMQISLDMQYGDDNYTLIRNYKRKGGNGESVKDYQEQIFLKKGPNVLTDDEREHFLNTTFPQRISRFYLFDAELLSEYEDLLVVDDANYKIKKSIEDILGLPVLEHSATILDAIQKELEGEALKNSKLDSKTKQDATLLESLNKKGEELCITRDEMQKKILKDERELGIVNDNMKATEVLRVINDKQDSIRNSITEKETYLQEVNTNISHGMDSLWKTMLHPTIVTIVKDAQSRLQELSNKLLVESVKNNINGFINDALSYPLTCPDCGARINDVVKKFLLDSVTQLSTTPLSEKEETERSSLLSLVSMFENTEVGETKSHISGLLKQKVNLDSQIVILKNSLDNLDKQRKVFKNTITKDETRSLLDQYSQLVNAIKSGKEGLSKCDYDIKSNEDDIAKVKLRIAQSSSKINKKAFENEKFAKDLHSLFQNAISAYSQRIKILVEKDATNFFTQIAHNSSYKKLEINDNYGLQIVQDNGEYAPNRSSGYEQVVAISLIGALHKNTPIEGPIIMDSTFQKIDPIHKAKVIDILPTLSEQVIVLAYDGEFDRKYAKESLKDKLVNEKRILNDNKRSQIQNQDISE